MSDDPEAFRAKIEEEKTRTADEILKRYRERQEKKNGQRPATRPETPARIFCIGCGKEIQAFPHDCEEEDGRTTH